MVHSNLPAVVEAERVSEWKEQTGWISEVTGRLSYTEIARRDNLDPRTSKKYAESETRPVYSLSDSFFRSSRVR